MTEFEYNIFRYIAEHSVSNAVEKEKIESEEAKRINNPSSQYCGIIYYYKVIFKNPVKIKNVKIKNGKDVKVIKGFHIMPYRINRNDMINAKPKGECGKFKEVIKTEPAFVDYDSDSGNFHKVPDGEFQVVLLDTNAKPDGPGEIKNDDKRDKNYNMYFPRPDSKKVHKGNDLEQFIKEAMEYLKENEKKE